MFRRTRKPKNQCQSSIIIGAMGWCLWLT